MEGADDVELCSLVRAHAERPLGRAAFALLYETHREAITAQAYTMVGDWARAEELAAETFTRVLRALTSGNGPQESVLGYLLIALRSEVSRAAQIDTKSVSVAPETIADFFDAVPDFVEELSERDQIANAFSSLTEDTRQVLWLVEVEGLATEEAAVHLNMTPGALRVALHRARKRLATSYLQQYVEVIDQGCLPFARKLASFTRHTLGKRDTATVEMHLLTCGDCTVQVGRLRTLSEQLRLWIGPLVIGAAAGGTAVGGGAVPAAHAASGTPGAHLVVASTPRKLIATLSLVAGVGLLIWGLTLVLPRDPIAQPVDPLPAHTDEASAVDKGQHDTSVENGTNSAPSDASSFPPPVDPVVEGDDETPHWYLQE
nr:sigma-70 family RNA polymerase sigma factor [Leucobacter sp. G161]